MGWYFDFSWRHCARKDLHGDFGAHIPARWIGEAGVLFTCTDTLGIGVGLAGWREGYYVSTAVSALNLLYYIYRDRSFTSFSVQVRTVWMAFMLIALSPSLWWMFIPLFLGMILVVLFDRCGIARVLIKMPWNKGVKLH